MYFISHVLCKMLIGIAKCHNDVAWHFAAPINILYGSLRNAKCKIFMLYEMLVSIKIQTNIREKDLIYVNQNYYIRKTYSNKPMFLFSIYEL